MSEEQSSVNANDTGEEQGSSGKRQLENGTENALPNLLNGQSEQNGPTQSHPEVRQENPFSFKHFLKRDASNCVTPTLTTGVCHSRSTSIINGDPTPGTPSKSATTSALNSQNHNTGARPKIPQFQSVHALQSSTSAQNSAESRMKRSPRFPSFDSQSSLSELSDEKYTSNSLFHSRSNSSFNSGSEYPVQRSFSNYDMDSPTNSKSHGSPRQPSSVSRLGTSEFSAALPDFVQDHLVMEQWYHGLNSSPKSASPVSSVDFENLPDFTINEREFRRNPSSSPIVPLDLPPVPTGRREQAPHDLPPDITEGQRGAFGGGGGMMGNRDQGPENKIQTLPDFLSDGPIHSSANRNAADVTHDTPHFNSPDENPATSAAVARLQIENERLRNELDDSRQIIISQTCRISELEHLLQQTRAEEAAGSRSSGLVGKLKVQVKQLQAELERTRRENESLREEGAVGGAGVGSHSRNPRTQQFARELRLAASTAESNLRQLLTGVDNLRMMASNLESLERQSDPKINDMSDDDESNFPGPGPAL